MFLIVVPATIGVLVSLLALRYKNNPVIRINEIEIFIGTIIFITNEIESYFGFVSYYFIRSIKVKAT